ncbi:hypothetical protein [Priestia abyssalis]|uniref:hypothetical protein n=1 Tax=Priestia abyssalis TaxID=1221450 RepID=UPI000994B5C7
MAFTFVNLSVISHFVIRQKKHKTIKGFFNYLVLPLMGAGTVGVLWISLETSSLIVGIVWAIFGFSYLTYLTRAFRTVPPQFQTEEVQV